MKKIILLLLVLAIFVSVLSSCGNGKKEDETKVNEQTNETSIETVAETVDINYACELPDALDYKDTEITLLCDDQSVRADEFVVDLEGYAMSQMVLTRNDAVEEELGVIINIQQEAYGSESSNQDTCMLIVETQLAGDEKIDIISAPSYRLTMFTLKGEYANLRKVDNLNLSKYYWAQNFNDIFSQGNKYQYIATGSIALSLYRCMFITLYNEDLFEARNIESIYDLVKKNEWTIEKQYEIAKEFTVDGDIKEEDKVYGLSTGYKISIDPYWVGFDINLIGKDETTGAYVNNSGNATVKSRLSDSVDKLQKLFTDPSVVVASYDDDGTNCKPAEIFTEGRAAMCTTMCLGIEKNIELLGEIDYAVAPMPKFDVEQKNFYTCIQDQVSCLAIPKNGGKIASNKEYLAMIGATLEALAAESYEFIVPEYYEKRLCLRYMTDPKDNEMIKLVYETSSIGIGAGYSGSAIEFLSTGYSTLLRKLVSESTNTTSSTLRGVASSFKNWVGSLNTKMVQD